MLTLSARHRLIFQVPKFWITSLSNCSDLSTHLPKCDHEALGFLTNVEVVHKADAREYDVNFVRSAPFSRVLIA